MIVGMRSSIAQLIATPLAPRDFLDLVNPLGSPHDLRARIDAITPETTDAVSVRLRVGRGWRGHRAGQYLRLGIDVDGVRQWRTYSLTCPETDTGYLTIAVTAIDGGVVSNHLASRAKPGTVVHLDQAAGDFTLPVRRPAKVLFVTAGSGITPVMGMLRSHLTDMPDAVVVHSARTPGDVIFGAELRRLHESGGILLVERHTATSERLDADELTRLVPDWADRQTWACGPAGLLDDLEAHWARQGHADNLHTERFTVPTHGTGEGGAVIFTRTGVSAETGPATTLLEAGENAGVLMPSGCRMGVCFGCVAPLRGGAVRDVRNGDITIGAPEAGVLVQTCVSTAAGSCELDV